LRRDRDAALRILIAPKGAPSHYDGMAQLLVESADGTSISAESYGDGPALVIVSGALFASKLWQGVVSRLSGERCVYVIDRRGRGKSGDSPKYSPEREVEDILALLRAIPGPIDLLGHSSGAILSLQVAARAPAKLERLIVYEPPVFFAETDRIKPDLPERLDALLAAGQPEAAVETFFREGPRASEDEISRMKGGPAWPQMVKYLAHTVPYDSRIQRAFAGDASELSRIRLPTLMLIGGASSERMRHGAETIAERLLNARIAEIEGQEHVAMLLAPVAFAAVVTDFLSSATT
jgi:pimeloyl-ACP methyl ester carboxylesterase